MSDIELLPCPWCLTAEYLHIVVETSRDKKRTVPIVACGKCATGGPKPFCLATYDEQTGELTDACQALAHAAWNRRASDALTAEARQAAEQIVAGIKEMQGKQLRVAFQDEQTAQYVEVLITNAGKVARALLAKVKEQGEG